MAVSNRAGYDFIVVSNRLPVRHALDEDGSGKWLHSPGGLVTALEPVMWASEGAWVGWVGEPDLDFEPFVSDGIHIIPVPLSREDVENYYEGFANGTLWPLYHDVIAPPCYERTWWEYYVAVNQRFADAAAEVAAAGAVVWVQDYQLQLVPQMLRLARDDLTIGFFNHIPFPPYGIFSQLPWRQQILEGLLGADVIGFQRSVDALNFTRAAGQTDHISHPPYIEVVGAHPHRVLAKEFPISIDSLSFDSLARRPDVQERAREIRSGLGNPKKVMLGVDRLDYTKGISHRLKAFGELLDEDRLNVDDVTLIQIASPSRERVQAYVHLRDEMELTVGRINGDYSTLSHAAISYHHRDYPREEIVALYLAADVMLVTALRDGMNLVAKEYVASRYDEHGVLVLSEFAGASDELRDAIRINPHDIEGVKDAMFRAVHMPQSEQRQRMRALRSVVFGNDVTHWSGQFLSALRAAGREQAVVPRQPPERERQRG